MTDDRQRRFLELLEPVYDRLSRYALAVTRDEMDGEDLVSATVLAAFEKFDHETQHENFLHYLIRIASRLHKRRRYRERRRVPYDEALARMQHSTGTSPDTTAEIRIVMDALQTLPGKMRETVVLFEVSDLSLEEIRRIQGGTLSGVKTRLKRGRERLATVLGVTLPEAKGLSISEPAPGQSIEPPINHIFLAQESYV
ncbi:MAG: RNA polymerase sigma factor [Bacteroidota bacterium]|nr:RNA polymerase sigma factor [Bacteroidota bacterium]MDP4232316.1 RNA polymerase sigma factor [Bacteroidota bacterium]MDP4241455.1 RNA polymerase sigma factor [Bacteroidota bacterium]MDP4286721.1 RNA polymerase sigma factor [Bacteroidota bacterium]